MTWASRLLVIVRFLSRFTIDLGEKANFVERQELSWWETSRRPGREDNFLLGLQTKETE